MKKFSQKLIALILGLALLFSVVPNSVTVSAATKNKVTTSISKVQSKAKGFKVTWKKKSKVKGYQIQYSTSKKFAKSKTKTKTVSSSKTTSATIKKLSGCGKKYYVRIRTYTVSNGKRVYSSWSKVKTVTTAKHKYEKATCTEAKTCKYCDKTSGKALGHKWKAATCTKAKTCTVCKKTTGKALGHKWKAATCTKAKTCTVCKKTSGKALGHEWESATCTTPKTCLVCDKTKGKALGHVWSNATCTTPKTCDVCEDTSGNALGHKWVKATCTTPKTCEVCNKTRGKALGHEWIDATCSTPQTCSVCDTIGGGVSGHNWKNYVCTDCGEIDKSHAYEYLVEWVKANGTTNGSYTQFRYEGDDMTYILSYSAQYDSLSVDSSSYSEEYYTFASVQLDSYFYGTTFEDLEVTGYIDARKFTPNTAITYKNYTGDADSKYTMIEYARVRVVDLINWLSWCLDTYEIGITISDLGFTSFE